MAGLYEYLVSKPPANAGKPMQAAHAVIRPTARATTVASQVTRTRPKAVEHLHLPRPNRLKSTETAISESIEGLPLYVTHLDNLKTASPSATVNTGTQIANPSVIQSSTGNNSPNVVTFGANSPVSINTEPLFWYDFDGAQHARNGNQFFAVAGNEMSTFHKMEKLETLHHWTALTELATAKTTEYPKWWTPFLFAGEAYGQLREWNKAIDFTSHGLALARGTPSESQPQFRMAEAQLEYFQKQKSQP